MIKLDFCYMLTVKVTQKMEDDLRKLAKDNNINLSEATRRVIESGLMNLQIGMPMSIGMEAEGEKVDVT